MARQCTSEERDTQRTFEDGGHALHGRDRLALLGGGLGHVGREDREVVLSRRRRVDLLLRVEVGLLFGHPGLHLVEDRGVLLVHVDKHELPGRATRTAEESYQVPFEEVHTY